MRVDIVADVICPWCFIGKRRLERAFALRPRLRPEITWHPFQLNPDMPSEGIDRELYLATKFGGGSGVAKIHASLREAGASVGIHFDFTRIRRTPNTQDAHRLIRRAGAKADRLVESLFHAYFIEGRDIGARATLLTIAAEAGFEKNATDAFLESEATLEEIVADDQNARRLGIHAVPCFIFDHNYAISGAQEPEFFLPIFDLVEARPPSLVNG
ncbi:MAG TPA: DsbA family oxidoreductase [Stellaceae bacterium]|nr:DsbA family oxidoreductase [Stellaceae bacterium]